MKTLLHHLLLTGLASLIYLGASCQYPGGVSANLNFWSKANASSGKITLSAGKVTTWTDEKSGFALTQATASKQPVWNEASASSLLFNYNPYLSFSTASQTFLYNSATTPDLASTTPTIFVVSTSDANEFDALTYYASGSYKYQIKPGFRVQSSSGAGTGYTADPPTDLVGKTPYITVLKNNGTSLVARRNAIQYSLSNNNSIYNPAISAGLCVGSNNNSEWINAPITEVIFYGSVLSNQSQYQVESYLGLKYGITLDRVGANYNYYNSLGASVFSDGADAGAYWNQVIGIVRDSLSTGGALYQKQSHQQDDSARLYLGALKASNDANTSTFASNLSYVVMGNNKGHLCSDQGAYIHQAPASSPYRLDRAWKIQVSGSTATTNVTDNFSMDIVLSSCAWGSSSAYSAVANVAGLGLLVNNTGNLTTGTFVPNYTSYGGATMTISLNSTTGTLTVTNLNAGLRSFLGSGSSGLNASNTPLYFTIASADASVLPILIASFTATATPDQTRVDISWASSIETNLASYTIERSADALHWTELQTVMPLGATLNTEQSYRQVDLNPLAGRSFYRIKITDDMGRVSYSPIRELQLSGLPLSLDRVTPNPFSSFLNLTLTLPSRGPLTLRLFDTYGKMLRTLSLEANQGENTIPLRDLQDLAPGIYIIESTFQNQRFSRKIVKLN